ncbi:MAG: hypothetical protein H0U57_02880 [Tatlockia sp.]|nr:hypothetical protein [Tatlockia sp.]
MLNECVEEFAAKDYQDYSSVYTQYSDNLFSDQKVIDHYIDLLNKHPLIDKLNLTQTVISGHTLKYLLSGLKHVKVITEIRASDDETLKFLAESNIVVNRVISDTNTFYNYTQPISESGLFNFLQRNISVNNLEIRDIPLDAVMENYNQMVNQEGIQYPCRLVGFRDNPNPILSKVNTVTDDFLKIKPILATIYQFYKSANAGDENLLTYLDLDVRRMIALLMLPPYFKELFEHNKIGYAKALQRNGFFIKSDEKDIHQEQGFYLGSQNYP